MAESVADVAVGVLVNARIASHFVVRTETTNVLKLFSGAGSSGVKMASLPRLESFSPVPFSVYPI
jgi:hypothetical protein